MSYDSIIVKHKTRAIHSGLTFSDPNFGSVAPPIYPSSTFIFPDAAEGAARFAGKSRGMVYSRFTNPTVQALEKRLAALENAEAALCTGSGMSAITTLFLHTLKKGDILLAHNVLYGGTVELISRILPRFGVSTKLIDFTDIAALEKAITPGVKMLYFETPTNPMMEVVDISAVSTIAKKHKILSAIDSTFAPAPVQYPIDLGIDVVIHSLTKYHGGHSDVIGGAIIGSNNFIGDLFHKTYPFLGPTMSPFTAYLVLRGITTLQVRLESISKSGMRIAQYLESHPKISKVYYPGLSSFAGHEIAKKQMSMFGGVMSFELVGGYKAAEKLVNSIDIFSLAVSLGGVESLIEHPASMTHSELTETEMKAAGIQPGLVRISVGLEDIDDLLGALETALSAL